MIIELGVVGGIYAAYRAVAGWRRRAGGKRHARIEGAFAEWATRAGFGEYGSRYRGTLDDVDVVIDSGVRASGCYGSEVRLALSLDEPRGTVRTPEGASTPLRDEIAAVMKRSPDITAARIEDDAVVMTLGASLEPERVERLARQMISACRPRAEAVGPYR